MHDKLASMSRQGLADILKAWPMEGLQPEGVIKPAGSPERCVDRVVLRDVQGGYWLLEWLHQAQIARRTWIGRLLEGLAGKGMGKLPLLARTCTGELLHAHNGRIWQLSQFIPGEPPPQPEYVQDAARGEGLAQFLVDLAMYGPEPGNLEPEPDPVPGLEVYIQGIMDRIRRREKELHASLLPVWERLDPAAAFMPPGLCHGDFHPINVIWQGKEVAGVIDWEFAGVRPLGYDAANLLGCVGSEHPQALVGPLALAFVRTLGQGGTLLHAHIPALVHLLPAIRFAWMSEWLRRDDREMVAQEVAYMQVLQENAQTLVRAWQDQFRTVCS